MIVYRDAAVQDAPAVGAMAAACFTETFGALYPPADLAAFLDQAFDAEGLPRHIADPAYRVRIALDDEAVVGFAKYAGSSSLPAPASPADAELKQLYVARSHHGAGVAAALMDWTIGQASGDGTPRLVLSVYSDNHRAKRFYARYGFAEIGFAPFAVGTQIDDDRIWSLTL
jgi:GNAT superfamily N-acetyltransferase